MILNGINYFDFYLFEVAVFLIRRSWTAFIIQSEYSVRKVLVATVYGNDVFAPILHPAFGFIEIGVVVDATALQLVHQFVPH